MVMLNQPTLPAEHRHGLPGCEPSPGFDPSCDSLFAALD
jgi:hypothetical protein